MQNILYHTQGNFVLLLLWFREDLAAVVPHIVSFSRKPNWYASLFIWFEKKNVYQWKIVIANLK